MVAGFAFAFTINKANTLLTAVVGARASIACFANPALLACTGAVNTVTMACTHEAVSLGGQTFFHGAVSAVETFGTFTPVEGAATLAKNLVAFVFAERELTVGTHPSIKTSTLVTDTSVSFLRVVQADTVKATRFAALGEGAVVVKVVAEALASTSRGVTLTTGRVTTMAVVDTVALGAVFPVEASVVDIKTPLFNSLVAFTFAFFADTVPRALVRTELGGAVNTGPRSRAETFFITADTTVLARSFASGDRAIISRVTRLALATGIETSSVLRAVVGANYKVERAIGTKIVAHTFACSLLSAHTTVTTFVGALALVAKFTFETIETDTLLCVGVTFTLFALRASLLFAVWTSEARFASAFELWGGSIISVTSTVGGAIWCFTTPRVLTVFT